VKIVVNAIKGRPIWPLAHIGEEILKLVPTHAHLNASSAVSAKATQ